MKRPNNLKVGDKFRVIEGNGYFNVEEIISFKDDNNTLYPHFWNADKSNFWFIHFSNLEPYVKSIRDAQVGDVVIGKVSGCEYMVLERGKNTVLLSYANNFKIAGSIFTFDELEAHFTLKGAPEVVDDKTAEAMKVLKEAGYKISKE